MPIIIISGLCLIALTHSYASFLCLKMPKGCVFFFLFFRRQYYSDSSQCHYRKALKLET